MIKFYTSTEWCFFVFVFFLRIELFLTASCRVILAGVWNTVLDPDIDRTGKKLGTSSWDVKPFCDFIGKFEACADVWQG